MGILYSYNMKMFWSYQKNILSIILLMCYNFNPPLLTTAYHYSLLWLSFTTINYHLPLLTTINHHQPPPIIVYYCPPSPIIFDHHLLLCLHAFRKDFYKGDSITYASYKLMTHICKTKWNSQDKYENICIYIFLTKIQQNFFCFSNNQAKKAITTTEGIKPTLNTYVIV